MGTAGPKVRATFSISKEVKARLDDAIPKSKRSRFVEEALERALKEAGRVAFLEKLNTMPRRKSDKSGVEILRRLREEIDPRQQADAS